MTSPIPPRPFSQYEPQGCGICEKFGAEVFWPSGFSQYAHADCYREIQKIEADLIEKIKDLFENSIDRIHAHVRATKAVRNALNKDTMKSFLDKHGEKGLKLTFDTFGIIAVQSPSAKL